MAYHERKLQNNQDGMVALLIVFVISAIITLVVVGMSKISVRNQQQTQESQLSTQAFYAAETGVQDALESLRSGSKKDVSSYNCDPATSIKLGDTSTVNSLSGDGQVEYSCQDIKLSLQDLAITANSKYSTRDVLRAFGTTGGNDSFSTIEIYWHKLDTTANGGDGTSVTPRGSASQLPTTTSTTGAWDSNTPALMRANLTYIPDINSPIGSTNNQQEIRTWYMVPMAAASPPSRTVNWATNIDLVPVDCSASTTLFGGYGCRAVINGRTFDGKGMVVLRLRTMYRDKASVKVVIKDSLGNIKTLTNPTSGIAQIDVTGRAGTVYRRIRVQADYKGTTSGTNLPEYSIESATDICKRTQVALQYSDIFNTSSPKNIQSPISSAVTDPTCGL